MTSILVLSREEMRELLTLEVMVPAIEKAFVAFAAGRSLAYPVVREAVEGHQGIFGSDVVVTAVGGRTPVLFSEWVEGVSTSTRSGPTPEGRWKSKPVSSVAPN